MEFQCLQSEFFAALSMCSRAIPTRSTGHPILANILIQAEANRLILTAFDLAIGIRVTLPASVQAPGSFTLPARTLNEIVSKLPEGGLSFSLEEPAMSISTGKGRYRILGMPSEEYPELPTPQGDCVEVPASALALGIKSTASICSTDETKQVLTGIHLTAQGKTLEFAATDGHRLARCVVVKEEPEEGSEDGAAWDFEVTVPARAMRDLERLLASSKEDDTVALYFDSGQILFQWGEQCLTSRTLDGQYPNYNQLIPQRFDLKATAPRKDLQAAIERVAVLADQKNNVVRLNLASAGQEIKVSVDAADVGNGQETLGAQIAGNGFELAFNHKYLQDGLKILGSQEVSLSLNSPTSPVVLEPLGKDRVLYLVMPVQIRD